MSWVPCRDPSRDPDDWFIEKSGHQYSDLDLVHPDVVHATAAARELTDPEEIDALGDEMESEALAAAKIRRRQARDACFSCSIRTVCLGLKLDPPGGELGESDAEYGIAGGYYPEQLKEIVKERERRRKSRMDDPAEEENLESP